jgi:hypothetical protein
MMRMTLTLDDDVVALLKKFQQDRGYGFKEALNFALREGLLGLEKPLKDRAPYRTPSVSLGRPRLPSLDNVSEVLAVAEGESYQKILAPAHPLDSRL